MTLTARRNENNSPLVLRLFQKLILEHTAKSWDVKRGHGTRARQTRPILLIKFNTIAKFEIAPSN